MPYWRLFYHIVWATKGREPLIVADWEEQMRRVIVAKAEALHALVHAVGNTEDHVHVAASVPPAVSLASFVAQLKGSSSHFVNHEIDLAARFAWQAEYGVQSFGGRELDTVVRYILHQTKHHRLGTTESGLERFETG
jgi:putative transposase